jgi:hypothetical protein
MAKTTIPGGYIEAGSIDATALAGNSVGISELNVSDGTSGQYLQTDGSGTLSFSTVSETTINTNADNRIITGSGTANTLNGESGLTYDGSTLDVTGTVTSSSDVIIASTVPRLILSETDVTNGNWDFRDSFGILKIRSLNDDLSTAQERLVIGSNGDISFYEDTGTTAKLFWDASTERLGIGTTSPSQNLSINNASGNAYLQCTSGNGNLGGVWVGDQADEYVGAFLYDNAIDASIFYVNNAERMRIESGGQVVLTASTPSIKMIDSDDNSAQFIQGYGGGLGYYADDNNAIASSFHRFFIDGTEKAKIDDSGDFTATNVYAGATGFSTLMVSFPNTTAYPNVSTYNLTLTAAQAPIGSRVIMSVWIASGSSSGDQYAYLAQNQSKGGTIRCFVEGWYYNSAGSSIFKIDNANDRVFTFTHATIVASTTSDVRQVYYHGYIMDN